MITHEDIIKVENQLSIKNLKVGAHLMTEVIDKEFIIHNFWIAKFKTYLDYDWHDLMIFIAKTSDGYSGLLLLSNDYHKLPLVEIPNWDHPVADALHNINIIIEEEPVTIFGEYIRYDFMVSSSSLTSYLEVSTSSKPRPSLDNLTGGIIKAIKHLVKIYNNPQLTNSLGVHVE